MAEAVTEKPLHVQVAEALGCRPVSFEVVGRGGGGTGWACQCPGANRGEGHGDVLGIERYDADWSVSGPLIARYQISLWPRPNDDDEGPEPREWGAKAHSDARYGRIIAGLACGPTPLVAVCNLILRLKATGKLEAA